MQGTPSKEQRAHDLAIAYGLYFSLKNDEKLLSPDGFAANYFQDYQEFMELLED